MRSLTVTALLATMACATAEPTGGSPPPPPAPPPSPPGVSMAGTWSLAWEVTTATGACALELGEQTTETITFTQTGATPPYQVVARGFLGLSRNQLTGTMNDAREITLSGSYPEENGTLTANYALTWDGAATLNGTETWTWTSATGSCPNSVSSVTGTKN